MEEFFCQGDLEKQLNMPVSATCDRSSVVVAQAQVFFIQYVVRPALEVYFRVPNTCEEICMKNLSICKENWDKEVKVLEDLNDNNNRNSNVSSASDYDKDEKTAKDFSKILQSPTSAAYLESDVTTIRRARKSNQSIRDKSIRKGKKS